MDPIRQQAKSLFQEATEFPDASERKRFLDQVCASNPALRKRLDELLANHARAEAFFSAQPSPIDTLERPSDGEPLADTSIGRYQLIKRLGNGGCGTVYLAEQREPIIRQLALKIIRIGINTKAIVERFEAERQTLALMSHPNIAGVLDAGETKSGLPYFVMERVDGIPITQYCDLNTLDLPQRLDLFVRVCKAVQHAHQKGVIHRDIKPSNILVTIQDGRPHPKLIDFGVAKAIQEPAESPDAGTGRCVGTPAYMSPEQAGTNGADVDTRSDIYSLGVLLSELLVGRAPYEEESPETATVLEMQSILKLRKPSAPSTTLAKYPESEWQRIAAQRCLSPAQLLRAISGDLDCIVLKALAKERHDRYESATALAMDIRRHLENEPVLAHPPGQLYRFRKQIRRNRLQYASAGLVFLSLLGGLGTSTVLFLRERSAREEQARLRNVAERSLANEAALRLKAEAREQVAQAVVMWSHGDIEQADAIVGQIPIKLIPPSLECAKLMRELGQRHALAGRWEPAAARHLALAKAITEVDASDSDQVSRNLLPASAAILESGNPVAYESFRRKAIERFAGSANLIVSEQILKATLLAPADESILRPLAPLAEIVENAVRGIDLQHDRDPYMTAWRHLALGFYAFRRGDDEKAIEWLHLCLASPNYNAPRSSMAQLLSAMAYDRLGLDREATALLILNRQIQDKAFKSPLLPFDGQNGFWFDWIDARILLREAEAMISD